MCIICLQRNIHQKGVVGKIWIGGALLAPSHELADAGHILVPRSVPRGANGLLLGRRLSASVVLLPEDSRIRVGSHVRLASQRLKCESACAINGSSIFGLSLFFG